MLQQATSSSSSSPASPDGRDGGRLSPYSCLLHHKASSHPLSQLAQISIPPRASLSSHQHQLPRYASPSLSPASATSTTVSPLSAASSASPSALSSPVPILSPHPVFHPACASRAMQPIVLDQYQQLQLQHHFHTHHPHHQHQQQHQQALQGGARGVRMFPAVSTSPCQRLPAPAASAASRMAGLPLPQARHAAMGTKRKMAVETETTTAASSVTAGLSLYAASSPPLLPAGSALSSPILPSSSSSPSPVLISACVSSSSQPVSPQSGSSSLASLSYYSSPQAQQEKRRRTTCTPSPVALSHISPRSLQSSFPPHCAAAASPSPSASPFASMASPLSVPSPSLSPLSSPSRTPFESPVPQRVQPAQSLPSPSLRRRHFLIPPIAIPSPPPSPLFYCSPSTSAAASPSWLSSSCCSASPPLQQQQQRSPFTALHPRYTVLHTLEQSLLSSVKLALDNLTRRHVCIKVARVASAANLQREAELLRCLQSRAQQPLPGVVELIEQLSDDEYCYLVTTWYERGDLFAVLSQQREQRLSAAAVQSMFASLVCAVHSLHRSLHVAHLDLSLENIVQAADDSVAIIDFGSAVFHPAAAPSPALSHPRAAAATLASAASSTFLCDPYPCSAPLPCKVCYCSPELLSHSAFDAYAADVFALGVILYTLSTGLPPFEKACEEADVWYRCISRGDWLRPELRQQEAARVYSEGVDERVLSIIDGCIKPESSRWSVDQLYDHPWVKEGRDRNQRNLRDGDREAAGEADRQQQTQDNKQEKAESKGVSAHSQPVAAAETGTQHQQEA